ncbi:MAG: leucyl/phenylalanyl-tRNA--protein transferase [Bacteroidetes bacterium]|nr:leucyl/phenylalanyl-tRNA--protein transferase [Bacteroidota bacterium]
MLTRLSENRIWFPSTELAEEDGLLAFGGDLSAERLLLAYSNGIFPWYSEADPILWYAPRKRFVLFPQKLKISASMIKVLNSGKFKVTYDQDFAQIIQSCATIKRTKQKGTWITAEMMSAYIALHELGHAHSVEVWENNLLVGGLYGVQINQVFCGESMFSRVSNASKAALIYLCQKLDFKMIDCQVYTQHLESMGAEFISSDEYLNVLQSNKKSDF